MSEPLAEYRSIDNDELAARFMVARAVSVETTEGKLEDLWKEHEEAMEEFRARWEERPAPGDLEEASPNLLDLKLKIAREILRECTLCERKCRVDRTREDGFCGVPVKPRISSEFLHMGEERVLVPSHTVFFCGCTFRCVYCQNWDIAFRPNDGVYVEPESLARVIRHRRAQGARNVNWVGGDPTPNVHYILDVLRRLDVNVPQVWNSNMYLTEETMKLLDGVIDLYLTDFKYGNDECAEKYSNAPNYWEVVTRNHREAHRQCDLIVRHLVLPGNVECCTFPILEWIAEELGTDTPLNVMPQYRPEHRAHEYQEINRRPSREELEKAWEKAKDLGFRYYRL
ncbi:radical SAM protein [Methanopyrus sp.]